MTSKREANRIDLTKRLIDAAEYEIKKNGLAGIKAREITKRAKCSLGALYNVFQDIDMLILHVNSRTLFRLSEKFKNSRAQKGSSNEDRLQALGAAYVEFVSENRSLWDVLFDYQPSETMVFPDWHREEHSVLVSEIVEPLKNMRPDLSPEKLVIRAQTMYAAVHGVVNLSYQGRFLNVPEDQLKLEVKALIKIMAKGSEVLQAD